VNVLYTFSAILGEGVGLVVAGSLTRLVQEWPPYIVLQVFSPGNVVFAGVGVLLLVSTVSRFFVAGNFDAQVSQTAKDVAASQDALVDVFSRVEGFLGRLETYTHVPLSDEMTDVIVNIMGEVLSILAIATRDIKQGRGSELILRGRPNFVAYSFSEKFMKKPMGKSDIENALGRLDKLTRDEVWMAVAQNLKTIHRVDDKVMIVGCGVQVVDEKADRILDSAQIAFR
jgi:hypothetical protein